jgi:hypothetical protein
MNTKQEKRINFEEAAQLIANNEVIDLALLDFGVNFEHREYLGNYAEPDSSKQCENDYHIYETHTLLHLAIQSNNVNMVRELLDQGADLTIPIKIIHVRIHKELKSISRPDSLSPQYEESESIDVKSEKSTEALVIEKNNVGILIEITKFEEKSRLEEQAISAINKTSIRDLKLYPFNNSSEAQQAENSFQTDVNDRFFRRNKFRKQLKKNGKAAFLAQEIDKIFKLTSSNNIQDNSLLDIKFNPQLKKLEFGSDQIKVAQFYLKNTIDLDGYSARSIILALTTILNTCHCIPTLAFKIGNNNILCISNPTRNQKGNVNIQAVNPDGTVKVIPSVYGDGNGKPQYSIAENLRQITTKNPGNNILESMKSKIRKVSSFSQGSINNNDAFFLDQLSFLHSIIEVARRGYEQNQNGLSNLDKLPMGTSQARTLQLLIDGQITIDEAYGLDTQNTQQQFYSPVKTISGYGGKKISPKQKYKSPYGAATGQDLESEHKEVQTKIERINAKYNTRYSTNSSSVLSFIEGRNLMRQNLGEQYGSDGESSGEDYSDDDLNKAFKISSLQFFKPTKTPKGYEFKWGDQKPSLKFISFSFYKSHNFSYVVQNNHIINNFLESMSLRKGTATTNYNNCLLHSYFQNIQNFFQSNYPDLKLSDKDFEKFVTYVRKMIAKVGGEMLSANDEDQGGEILKAIQQYLQREFSGKKFRFNLEILFADRDGDIAIVDNLNEIENKVPKEQGQITIPLQIIQVGFNHYEPIFINLSGQQVQNQQVSTTTSSTSTTSNTSVSTPTKN